MAIPFYRAMLEVQQASLAFTILNGTPTAVAKLDN